MAGVRKIEISDGVFSFENNILMLRLNENTDMTAETLREQFIAEKQIVKDQRYAVAIDATNGVNPDKEARNIYANHNPDNRVATAIIVAENLAVLMLSRFYLRVNVPINKTKIFRTESDAMDWLTIQLAMAT